MQVSAAVRHTHTHTHIYIYIYVVRLQKVNYLSHRKLTSVSLHLHTERRSVTFPEVSDDGLLHLESLTLWDFAHLSVFKNNGRRSTEHYVWGGQNWSPKHSVLFFFSILSVCRYLEESEAFSSCNFLNPFGALCIRSKFSPEHHLLQHPQSLLFLYQRTPGFTVT